jgi:hypothetical protein
MITCDFIYVGVQLVGHIAEDGENGETSNDGSDGI